MEANWVRLGSAGLANETQWCWISSIPPHCGDDEYEDGCGVGHDGVCCDNDDDN